MNCQCKQCRAACKTRPGWFARGEAEQAAAVKGMTLGEFQKYIVFDEAFCGEERIRILSPATTVDMPGTVRSFAHTGTCVFYQNGRCSIHEAKPAECRMVDHTTTPMQHDQLRIAIANTWRANGRA